MAKSSKNESPLCIICIIAAVAGVVEGYFLHNPLIPVLSLIPAAVFLIFYVDELTSGWAKWGFFIVINIEGMLLAKNIKIDVAHYLVKFTSDLPVMDLRIVLTILLAYFSYILARKTTGKYTRVLALSMLVCSMVIFYLVDLSLRA